MSAVVSRPPTRKGPPILQRLLRMTELRREIGGGAFQRHLRLAVDVLQSCLVGHWFVPDSLLEESGFEPLVPL